MVRKYPINAQAVPPPLVPDPNATVNVNPASSGENKKLGDRLYDKYLNHVKDFQESEEGKKLTDLLSGAKNILGSYKKIMKLLKAPFASGRKKFYEVKEKRVKKGMANMPQPYFWDRELQSHAPSPNITDLAKDALNSLDEDTSSELPQTYDIDDYQAENEPNQPNQQPQHNHNLRQHLLKVGPISRRNKGLPKGRKK